MIDNSLLPIEKLQMPDETFLNLKQIEKNKSIIKTHLSRTQNNKISKLNIEVLENKKTILVQVKRLEKSNFIVFIDNQIKDGKKETASSIVNCLLAITKARNIDLSLKKVSKEFKEEFKKYVKQETISSCMTNNYNGDMTNWKPRNILLEFDKFLQIKTQKDLDSYNVSYNHNFTFEQRQKTLDVWNKNKKDKNTFKA